MEVIHRVARIFFFFLIFLPRQPFHRGCKAAEKLHEAQGKFKTLFSHQEGLL